MDYKRVLENPSSAGVKCHYLFEGCKVFEYPSETSNKPGTLDKGAKDLGSNAVLL